MSQSRARNGPPWLEEVVAAVEYDRDHRGDGVEPHDAPRISFAPRQKRTHGVDAHQRRAQSRAGASATSPARATCRADVISSATHYTSPARHQKRPGGADARRRRARTRAEA